MYFAIDNISDCILWFVEHFILIKAAANLIRSGRNCGLFPSRRACFAPRACPRARPCLPVQQADAESETKYIPLILIFIIVSVCQSHT